jgi:hypothetical protein
MSGGSRAFALMMGVFNAALGALNMHFAEHGYALNAVLAVACFVTTCVLFYKAASE